jgi:hypothetical protein
LEILDFTTIYHELVEDAQILAESKRLTTKFQIWLGGPARHDVATLTVNLRKVSSVEISQRLINLVCRHERPM